MKKKRKSIRHEGFEAIDRFPAQEDASADLHGLTCEEAESVIDKHLDSLAPGDRLLVIHGKGTGVLRDHVRKYLANHKKVKTVLLGERERFPGKGGVCVAIIR